MSSSPRFPEEGLKFLRALKRNNRREWFQAHREEYEKYVRGPMMDFVLALREEFARWAPEMVADPAFSLYRIYRDMRFSKDKSPYKTHTAAVFPRRGLSKNAGAGLYFHVAPDETVIGGGIYMPGPQELLAVRRHIAEHYRKYRSIVESPEFRRLFRDWENARLQRVPRGFPPDHPAGEYLKQKQFIAGCDFPAEFAASPRFYPTLVDRLRKMLPFVRFLNQPLLRAASKLGGVKPPLHGL